MAKLLRVPGFVRIGNLFVTAVPRRGMMINTNTLLTVPGRKSGRPRTTPVTIIEHEGGRYVSSSFGDVDWVRNLRAARLSRHPPLTGQVQRATVPGAGAIYDVALI
jgi:hypothetical protein